MSATVAPLRSLNIATKPPNTLSVVVNGDVSPATPEENLAASALMTLLSSPSPSSRKQADKWEPALKRQKSDPSVAMRRVAAATSHQTAKASSPKVKKAPAEAPSAPVEQPLPESTRPGIEQVVAEAMGGDGIDHAKLIEAERWLYRQVELVRGKYKGRSAAVVGMTAKKYRVRVHGVEHQLEFYPSMFKNPVPIEGLKPETEAAAATQVTSQTTPSSSPRAQPPNAPTEAPRETERDVEGSSTGSIDEDASDGSCATLTGSTAAPRTKEQLLKLMEETNAEMRRAKDMLLGYQEASNQIGWKGLGAPRLESPRAAEASKQQQQQQPFSTACQPERVSPCSLIVPQSHTTESAPQTVSTSQSQGRAAPSTHGSDCVGMQQEAHNRCVAESAPKSTQMPLTAIPEAAHEQADRKSEGASVVQDETVPGPKMPKLPSKVPDQSEGPTVETTMQSSPVFSA